MLLSAGKLSIAVLQRRLSEQGVVQTVCRERKDCAKELMQTFCVKQGQMEWGRYPQTVKAARGKRWLEEMNYEQNRVYFGERTLAMWDRDVELPTSYNLRAEAQRTESLGTVNANVFPQQGGYTCISHGWNEPHSTLIR